MIYFGDAGDDVQYCNLKRVVFLLGEGWRRTLSAGIDSDVAHLPSVPYIYSADNDVAQSSASTARCVERSERRAFPLALKRKLFHATGELITMVIYCYGLYMASCGGIAASGLSCAHCLHELIHMFPTFHRSRTYILQTMMLPRCHN